MKKYLPYLALVALALLAYGFFNYPENQTALGDAISRDSIPNLAENNSVAIEEPRWKKWPRVREVSDPLLGVVLGDLESHMQRGHQYTDKNKMTWAHETTHGINAKIRNSVTAKEAFNGFYVLQDRAIVLKEPTITIRDVAGVIPPALRGPSFKLYLEDQALAWNDRPLYLMDEWIAYTNGAEAGKELNVRGWYYELLQAHNFNVYCMYMAMVVQRDCSDYRDVELKQFLKWNIERVFRHSLPSDRTKEDVGLPISEKVVASSNAFICPHCTFPGVGAENNLQVVKDYVEKVRTLPEAEKLRKFAREYFGEEWCKKVYGF